MNTSKWYKQRVASLTLTDVLPELAHDTAVCRLDAERERLAREYEAADGALLRQIAAHLKNDGSGRWSRYVKARGRSGETTLHERMRIAQGLPVDVMRFNREMVYDLTHCPDCGGFLPSCACKHQQSGEYTCRECRQVVTMPCVLRAWLLDGGTVDVCVDCFNNLTELNPFAAPQFRQHGVELSMEMLSDAYFLSELETHGCVVAPASTTKSD